MNSEYMEATAVKSNEAEKNLHFRRQLSDGLVLKTVANSEDIERVAQCHNVSFEEEAIGTLCRTLFLHHPST